MSRTTQHGPATPSKEFSLDLDSHGFELDPEAPAQVEGTIIPDTHAYLLQFTAAAATWRIELMPTANQTIEPVYVYQDGALVASRPEHDASDLEALPEWVQYVISHVRSEVF